jgi:hypothetical protein
VELNRDKLLRELDKLYYYILNTNLTDRISERDITTIINAAALLVEDGKIIKELTEKLNHSEIAYNDLYEGATEEIKFLREKIEELT